MRVPFEFLDNEVCLIRLADNEWGNPLMQQVAEEFFRDNPTCDFVEVWEHAGWALGFRRDQSIWSTANDMARLKPGPKAGMLVYSITRHDDGSYDSHSLLQRARIVGNYERTVA